MEKIDIHWEQNMSFKATVNGFNINLDAAQENGGDDLAPRPKPLLLVALAGCTGMDVASLARKMRVEIEEFNVEAEAEKSDDIPMVYTEIRLIYKFKADEANRAKIIKMVTLSQERYCGVSAMLSKATSISYRIELNGERIK